MIFSSMNPNVTVAASPIGANQVLQSTSTTAGAWVSLDATATDIKALGTQAAGSTGLVPDAGHVHPLTNIASSTGYAKTTAATTPNASLGVFGSANVIGVDAGFIGISVDNAYIISTSVGSETVTFGVIPTFKTAGAGTEKTATLTTSTTTFQSNTLLFANLYLDGDILTQISFRCKSSINSSTASLTFTLLGYNAS